MEKMMETASQEAISRVKNRLKGLRFTETRIKSLHAEVRALQAGAEAAREEGIFARPALRETHRVIGALFQLQRHGGTVRRQIGDLDSPEAVFWIAIVSRVRTRRVTMRTAVGQLHG